MPVSGHEETGVKSIAGQFSGLTAGVPIKKRRWFPLNRPSSPLTEEPCSLTEETDLQRKENSSNSQGSTLSNATAAGAPIKKRRFPSVQASSAPLEEGSFPEESDILRKEHSSTSQGSTLSTSTSGLSDINGIVFEDKKASTDLTHAKKVQTDSGLLRPKLEEPTIATQSSTLDVMDSKEKVKLNEGSDKKLGSQMIKGNPELLLAAKQSLALNIGADMSKQSVQDICKQEYAIVPDSTHLSLRLKDHEFPAVGSSEIHNSSKIEEVEPVSLELSLSKEEHTTQNSSSDAKINSDTPRVHSNRANWDLNTTMDAWEESGTDASSVKPSVDGMKASGGALDEKQFMCSTEMVLPTGVESVKQTLEESQRKSLIISSGPYGQHKLVLPRDLCLTTYPSKFAELSRVSVTLNPSNATPTVSSSSLIASGDVNASSFRSVKSEPFDENLKRNLKEANASSLDSVSVKQEIVQHSIVESSKSVPVGNTMLVDPKLVKPEPSHDGNDERPKASEGKTDRLDNELSQGSDICSSALAVPVPVTSEAAKVPAETVCPPMKPVCSADLKSCSAQLTTPENVVSHQENCTSTTEVNVQEVSPGAFAVQVPSETDMKPIVDNGTEHTDASTKDSLITKEENADNRDGCRVKLMNEPTPHPRDRGDSCVSDEEKITLSTDMMEDDPYGSDYDSDDNRAVNVPVDTEQYAEDDDYEDGEVREPLQQSTAQDTICEVREVEHPDSNNFGNRQMEEGGVIGDCPTLSHAVEDDKTAVTHGEVKVGEDGVDIEMLERSAKVVDKIVCMQESVDNEKPNIASDGKQLVNLLQTKPLDLSDRQNASKTVEMELCSFQGTANNGEEAVQCANEVVKTADTVRQIDLDLPKMEVFANADDAGKDVNNGGNQGRIIDLSRAASSSSPSKTRSMSGRSLPSRGGRDVLSDTLDGDKLPRVRDDVYIDAPRKFSRERHQDISPRNSRMNFVRGRGRVNNRMDTLRGDWESDREFSGEFYNGPGQFRGPRKYASAIADSDMEFNNVAPDGSYVGHGRMGRKPLNDGSYIPPRRRSPGGRDGIQMGHRIPRNISPSRCIGGDGSEMVGMRHSEKFMRGFPDDTIDSMFTRPQPFDGLDGRFTRGNRNFSSMQRRGLPRMRSKSPIRSRSRSPGPWSSPRRRSPRRRSPDGFGGHPELGHRRSPLYRVDRMRSPERPVFGERVVRRHGSPSYMSRPSNDIRDIDSARDHGHPRSVMSNRSPSGRILVRNRRFDVVDPRDRADNDDDFFGGPMHSGRILELNNEGNGEERRRFGERRGPDRSFRPPYNGNVNENFHLNAEEGPRHYRFCSEDSDFHERGNAMRERDFDRRIKGRPGNVPPPRRTRNMDEQEDNFRHGGGQVWSDDSFDDISRVKRKRF
ncbi:hypothetical protein HN51_056464 [Arachis hypogaea]|uniref:uncharacterized protein n=1 Tax=Arachis hypogaea TaxID=3818 RepID=UPI000DED4299|nr:uncharacterized protein LOC112779653 [Arachis hypogaea]XP_025679776.1 uncharacterized protein LOC112779653 [Arachis hypogaea]XP_025679777.1 uncharacterized protein LOC112779653 [Arachis hypogaea]